MVCHVFGKHFGVEGFFNDGTGIPQTFQRVVFAGKLILFVTNHVLSVFKFQFLVFNSLVITMRRYNGVQAGLSVMVRYGSFLSVIYAYSG